MECVNPHIVKWKPHRGLGKCDVVHPLRFAVATATSVTVRMFSMLAVTQFIVKPLLTRITSSKTDLHSTEGVVIQVLSCPAK